MSAAIHIVNEDADLGVAVCGQILLSGEPRTADEPGLATCRKCRIDYIVAVVADMIMKIEEGDGIKRAGIKIGRELALERANNITSWLDLEFSIGTSK